MKYSILYKFLMLFSLFRVYLDKRADNCILLKYSYLEILKFLNFNRFCVYFGLLLINFIKNCYNNFYI